MKKYIFPTIVLMCALGLSITAAFYSIIGLSLLFAGVAIPVIIMASFLESAKILIATLLHNNWNKLNKLLKIYLTSSVIILSLITSLGIYGLLSSGYKQTSNKLEVISKQISTLGLKKDRFVESLNFLNLEKISIDEDISLLREGLANNRIQYRDKKTGEIITTTSSSNRKSLESQLEKSQIQRQLVNDKITSLNDSITSIELEILEISSNQELAAEVGPLKYISQILNKNMDSVVNILILIIIFIFDPLALSLVITANFLFNQIRPKPPIKENTLENKQIENSEPLEEVKKNLEESSPLPPTPKLDKFKKILNDPSISAWRKNKIKKQIEDEGDSIRYW